MPDRGRRRPRGAGQQAGTGLRPVLPARTPPGSRDEGGTGLGLPIVREIVTAHGGTVTLHDNEPGLLVRVTLPGPVSPRA